MNHQGTESILELAVERRVVPRHIFGERAINFSINTGEFRVVLAPPIAKAVVELEWTASVVSRDRIEIVRFLDAEMPWWRESVVLVEELFDRKKGIWRDCTWQYRKVGDGGTAPDGHNVEVTGGGLPPSR